MTQKPYRHTPPTGPPGDRICSYAAWKDDPDEPWSHRCYSWNGCLQACDRRQREVSATAREKRKFPKPQHPNRGMGWCSWCGEKIMRTEGPKAGQQNMQRTWHPDCVEAFFLHTRLPEQTAFLLQRDGLGCWDCGAIKGQWRQGVARDPDKLRTYGPSWVRLYPADTFVAQFTATWWVSHHEVDHTIPLWSVADLPDEDRMVYFGPVNLRLRCVDCHKAKTAREAAERAARRRLDAPEAI